MAENGICHRDRECCDKMTCSDHFGVGKCIPLTSSAPVPSTWRQTGSQTWPQTWPCTQTWPPLYPPWCVPLQKKKKKKKKKKKTKILIRVCGDLMGMNVKAKKKDSLFKRLTCKQMRELYGNKEKTKQK